MKRFGNVLPFLRKADPVEERLRTFDELDFEVFSNKKWDRLSESHSEEIVVTWPDGHQTKGLAKHIEDLKALFAFSPDLKIKEHPIRFGSDEWTCVTSVMTGTFSQPMATGNGGIVPPTNKTFRVTMVTIGHWKGGVMDQELLFWDNKEFMRQIGLGR